jgi:predicted flap endonuclease-1-like 5' DNA nuclease
MGRGFDLEAPQWELYASAMNPSSLLCLLCVLATRAVNSATFPSFESTTAANSKHPEPLVGAKEEGDRIIFNGHLSGPDAYLQDVTDLLAAGTSALAPVPLQAKAALSLSTELAHRRGYDRFTAGSLTPDRVVFPKSDEELWSGAGITSMADLAGSTPAKVAGAMTGVSTENAATFIQAARAALISAATSPSPTTGLFQPKANLVTESQPRAPKATESQSESLASIPGLGHKRITRLSAAGIDSIEKLAGATPAQVAGALKNAGVSLKSAKVFIDRAMQLTVKKHTQLVG